MSNTYLIHWKSNVNCRAGKGSRQFSLEEAQRLVEELNHDYPEIEHVLIEAPPPEAPRPEEAQSGDPAAAAEFQSPPDDEVEPETKTRPEENEAFQRESTHLDATPFRSERLSLN